jgi:hypothetical protein
LKPPPVGSPRSRPRWDELKSAERDLAAGGGWALEWTRLRWSLLDEHRRWLDDFLAQHPARVKARSAARLLEAADPEGASPRCAGGGGNLDGPGRRESGTSLPQGRTTPD